MKFTSCRLPKSYLMIELCEDVSWEGGIGFPVVPEIAFVEKGKQSARSILEFQKEYVAMKRPISERNI